MRKRFEERDNVLRKRCQEKTDVKVKRCQETQLTWKRHVQGKRLEFREIERTCKRKKQDTFFNAQMVSHTAYRYRILQDYIATSSLAKEVKNS